MAQFLAGKSRSEGVGGTLRAGNLPNGFPFIGFLTGNPANGFPFIGFLAGNPANGFPFMGFLMENPIPKGSAVDVVQEM